MENTEKQTPMGGYAFQSGPFTVYEIAAKIRIDMARGGDLEEIRLHHTDWSGLPAETIDIIIETIQSERATYGNDYPKRMH
ncbi:MAG TPA: hypothetical protein VLQ48_07355 [Chloroflexia bacterium]|nr:hypothetical protein [Chloroflexia bacterium]